MNRFWNLLSVLTIMSLTFSTTTHAAINDSINVTAKTKDNPQKNPQTDIEGHFTKEPTGDKDEIRVINEKAVGEGKGVYPDPINDGTLLTITQKTGPVIVSVEGRKGIGAMYWVTVSIGGTGTQPGTGGLLWADVEDMKKAGALVLRDVISDAAKIDSTNVDTDTPTLYSSAEKGKGKIDFWLIAEPNFGTYDWNLKQYSISIATGVLTSTSYKAEINNLSPGLYVLEVIKRGLYQFKRTINLSVCEIKRDVAGGFEIYESLTDTLRTVLPGQKMNYKVEVTTPLGVTANGYNWILPSVTFKNYEADQTKGVLTNLLASDLTNQIVHFYWVDAGDDRIINCEVSFSNGDKGIIIAKFNVRKPIVTFTTTLGHAGMNWDEDEIGLYTTPESTAGITYTGKVKMPAEFATEGKWNWVQLATPQRNAILDTPASTKRKYSLNGTQVLDTTYPYEPSPYTAYPGDAGSYATGDTSQTTSDTPHQGLTAGYKKFDINDENFVMTLMFLPPGQESRYVPTKSIIWRWTVKATLGINNKWTLDPDAATQSVTPAADTTSHPTWSANVSSGIWVNE